MHAKRTVLAYLEADVRRRPDACAVVEEHATHSYARLHECSRRAGSALATHGVCKRPTIVLMEKGFPLLCAFFGTLYAGGFYVPVDPRMPQERIKRISATLGDPIVIFDDATKATAEESLPHSERVSIDALLGHSLHDASLAAIQSEILDIDPAYVLFTSGSTGSPKGVAVSHRAIVDFIDSFVDLFDLDANSVFGNQAPFDFDVSVKDIYGSLACGGTLVIIPRALFSEPAALLDFLNERRVTVMIWAVSALCLISCLHGLEYRGLPAVRLVMFSGEVMPVGHLRTWLAHLPAARFVNLYGPTEVVCNCMYHVVDRQRDYAEGIPLGKAFPNRQVFLMGDGGLQVTDPSVVGELYVRGTSLALGYYGEEGQTRAAFVQSPLATTCPETVYRTGDLAYYSAEGELFFHGRKDGQIKHQGHRIELEEIEASLERHAAVDRCRCVYDRARKHICAFYEGEADVQTVRDEAVRRLPTFMVPTVIRQVGCMPLTKNGKIDRGQLSLMTDQPAPARPSTQQPRRPIRKETVA